MEYNLSRISYVPRHDISFVIIRLFVIQMCANLVLLRGLGGLVSLYSLFAINI